jgi:hypothetical protein
VISKGSPRPTTKVSILMKLCAAAIGPTWEREIVQRSMSYKRSEGRKREKREKRERERDEK